MMSNPVNKRDGYGFYMEYKKRRRDDWEIQVVIHEGGI